MKKSDKDFTAGVHLNEPFFKLLSPLLLINGLEEWSDANVIWFNAHPSSFLVK